MISRIRSGLLSDDRHRVSVAMVDSGFVHVPSYAVVHGANYTSGTQHGDRMLSIFTALDRLHPLVNLKLHLACYNPATGYNGLVDALRMLPDCDILSISISWRDDNPIVRESMQRKFKTICVPFSIELPYPCEYDFTTTCSNRDDSRADYSIRPNPEWHGNSYAVPAMARLLAYGMDMDELVAFGDSGESVESLFADCVNGVAVPEPDGDILPGIMTCPHCHRHMKSERTHGFVKINADRCPYCGLPFSMGKNI